MSIDDYIPAFLSLNTAKRMGQVAPHKAVMLLAVIDLIENGTISSSSFQLSEALESKFLQNWKRYVGSSLLFKPVPATPFWHLGSESFWFLSRLDGKPLTEITETPSLSKIRSCGITACLDKDLFCLLRSEDNRAVVRTTLISKYLNGHHQVRKVLPIVLGLVATRLWI